MTRSLLVFVTTAIFATLGAPPTISARPRRGKPQRPVETKQKPNVHRFARRLRLDKTPNADAQPLIPYQHKGNQQLASAPTNVTPAGGRWGGKKVDAINKRLNLQPDDFVYLRPADVVALDAQIENEHRPLAELQTSKRAESKHLHLIAVSIALEKAKSELERQQVNLKELERVARSRTDDQRPIHPAKISRARAAFVKQDARVKTLQAFLDFRPAYVSETGLALAERRRLAATPEEVHVEGRIAKTNLNAIEAEIEALTSEQSKGWWNFSDTLKALFANLPQLQKLSDWQLNRKVTRTQSQAQFVRIPTWRLSQILGGLSMPLFTTDDLTQTLEDMVRHFADVGVPVNRPINSEKVLRSLPNLNKGIKNGDLALRLLLKHIEHGGTIRLAHLSKINGALLDLPSQRENIATASRTSTRASYDGSINEITLNIANLSVAPVWNSNRNDVLARYNIDLAHEASHGVVASAELLPSRLLETVLAEPREKVLGLSLRTVETFHGRPTLRKVSNRIRGSAYSYFVYDSVMSRLRHSSNRQIIEDLNATFEKLAQRGLLPGTLLQIDPLIDRLRNSQALQKAQDQLVKILKEDLYSSLSRSGRIQANLAFYKASNLRGAADESLAQRVNGGKIDYNLYSNLDQGLQATLEETVLPNVEQYMRRPEIYREFVDVLNSTESFQRENQDHLP